MKKIFLLLFVLVTSSFVFSQEAEEGFDEDSIENVVTTALLKEETVQDASVAVTVLTGSDIDERGIRDLEDAQFQVPGLYFTQSTFTGAAISIRGIPNLSGAGASFSGNVSYRMDGSNVTAAWFADGEMFDVQALEVLRGPQGTLFGGSNPAGSVIISSATPTSAKHNYFDFETGDHELSKFTLGHTVRFSDKAATRFAIRKTNRDGFVMNLQTGEKIDDKDYLGARMVTEYDFDNGATLRFIAFHQSRDDKSGRLMKTSCDPVIIFGCQHNLTGTFPDPGGLLDTNGSYFSSIDLLTGLYPGNGLISDPTINVYENTVVPTDSYKVSHPLTPSKEIDSNLFSLNLEQNIFGHDFVLNYAYYEHEYDSYGALNEATMDRPYHMGGVVNASLFEGRYAGAFTRDMIVDRSYSDNKNQELELRILSDSDGPLNYVAGLYSRVYKSTTIYEIESPGIEYFGNVGAGPVGQMFPALANKGGLTFWAAFTGIYNTSIYGNLQTAATDFVLSDPASLAAIAAAVPGLVASGLTLAQAQAAATGQLVLANFSNPALRAAAVQGTMAQTAGTVQFLESAGLVTFKPAFGDWQKNFESDQEIKNVEEAIFAEVDYDLSDKWQVRLGVRWMDTRKDSLARSGVLDINQFQTAYYATEAEANATLPRNRANFETVTGRVIFDYQLNEDTLLYFGYNKGTKPGGYEPAVDTQAAAQLGDILVDTEEHDIFEIGTKGSYFGGALVLNANVYQNSITGNQLQRLVGLATSTYNGDTENTGFEVEAFAFLSESTRIDASISGNDHVYTNATGVDPNNPYGATQMLPLGADGTLIQSFNGAAFASLGIPGFGQNYLNLNHEGLAQAFGNNAGAIYAITTYGMTDVGPIFTQFGLLCNQPFALVCPDPGIDQDLNGNKVQYVPELAYKFGLEQDVMNNAAGTMTLRFEHTYVGERFVTEFNTMELPSYQFSNLSLRYVHSSDRFGFNLKVYNLLDEDLIIGGSKGSNANGGVITYYQLRPTATNLQFFVRY